MSLRAPRERYFWGRVVEVGLLVCVCVGCFILDQRWADCLHCDYFHYRFEVDTNPLHVKSFRRALSRVAGCFARLILLVRLCCVNGRASKPNVLVDKHYKIWIGNPGDQEASYSGEIFGFNTGSFEYKVINHTSKRDASGIAFRLTTDTDLIVHDKVVLPFCKFLHNAAVKHGLADVTLTDHLLEPKLHPAVPRLFE